MIIIKSQSYSQNYSADTINNRIILYGISEYPGEPYYLYGYNDACGIAYNLNYNANNIYIYYQSNYYNNITWVKIIYMYNFVAYWQYFDEYNNFYYQIAWQSSGGTIDLLMPLRVMYVSSFNLSQNSCIINFYGGNYRLLYNSYIENCYINFDLATDSNFTNLIIDNNSIPITYTYESDDMGGSCYKWNYSYTASNLTPNTKYYVRVRRVVKYNRLTCVKYSYSPYMYYSFTTVKNNKPILQTIMQTR